MSACPCELEVGGTSGLEQPGAIIAAANPNPAIITVRREASGKPDDDMAMLLDCLSDDSFAADQMSIAHGTEPLIVGAMRDLHDLTIRASDPMASRSGGPWDLGQRGRP
jgi:hypothetical protein